MPVPDDVRRAFERKVRELLAAADALSNDAVRRALELLEATRREIAGELARVPADSFTARHLTQLRTAVSQAIADLVRREQAQVPALLERAHELGIDLAEEPFAAAGARLAPTAVPRSVLAVLQGYTADLITNLGNEARRRINGILAQAALGAISPFEAIQRIAGNLPDGSAFRTVQARAEAILRTEVNRVFEVGQQARMNEMSGRLPGLKKQWLSAGDDKVRPTHVEADGQIVPARAKFRVGTFRAMFPRDPVLPGKESVNCRCHSTPLLDEETLGGLRSPAVLTF